MTRRLESSVAATWRHGVAGPDERLRNWRTRVGYYRAVGALLSGRDGGPIDIAEIIRHHPTGRPSTVYALAASGTLVDAYRAARDPRIGPIADLVGPGPVDRLVAEARVWSFWPLRQAWVSELDESYPRGDFDQASRQLVAAVAQWRSVHPALAGAQGGAPPLCVVEDMVVLSRHTLSPVAAGRAVAEIAAAGPDGRCPFKAVAGADVVATGIAEVIELLGDARTADPDRRAAAVCVLRSILNEVEVLREGTATRVRCDRTT